MKILDTNLWVFGTLQTNEQAVELLAEIDRSETTSAVNAYMLQEALDAVVRHRVSLQRIAILSKRGF